MIAQLNCSVKKHRFIQGTWMFRQRREERLQDDKSDIRDSASRMGHFTFDVNVQHAAAMYDRSKVIEYPP